MREGSFFVVVGVIKKTSEPLYTPPISVIIYTDGTKKNYCKRDSLNRGGSLFALKKQSLTRSSDCKTPVKPDRVAAHIGCAAHRQSRGTPPGERRAS